MSFNSKQLWRGFLEGLAMPAVGVVWAFNRVTGRDALIDRIEGLEADLERERSKRSSGPHALYVNGKLIIGHPDMPPHMWDGEKMVRIKWSG